MTRKTDIQQSVADKWKQSRRLLRLGDQGQGEDCCCDDLLQLEEGVLKGPIHSIHDAFAKLKAVELAFVEGERTDGADAAALRQAIRWLRANYHATADSSEQSRRQVA